MLQGDIRHVVVGKVGALRVDVAPLVLEACGQPAQLARRDKVLGGVVPDVDVAVVRIIVVEVAVIARIRFGGAEFFGDDDGASGDVGLQPQGLDLGSLGAGAPVTDDAHGDVAGLELIQQGLGVGAQAELGLVVAVQVQQVLLFNGEVIAIDQGAEGVAALVVAAQQKGIGVLGMLRDERAGNFAVC